MKIHIRSSVQEEDSFTAHSIAKRAPENFRVDALRCESLLLHQELIYSHTPTPLTSLPDTRTLAPGIQLTADSRDVDIPTSFSSSRTARVRPETSIRPAAPVTCSGNSQQELIWQERLIEERKGKQRIFLQHRVSIPLAFNYLKGLTTLNLKESGKPR